MDFKDYLKLANQFKLGHLTTESFHPKTINLSSDSKNNLPKALSSLKEVDTDAFNLLKPLKNQIYELYKQVEQTRLNGNKVFLCGCGATGRLSLAIETLALQEGICDITSFMAGGDYALIKSVESFEDKQDYGARQLNDLGFSDGDLLLAITEGGETSFVIGAAIEASLKSKVSPYFIYCNPDSELLAIERCNRVLSDSKITKLNLTIGPMGLSGSTRMQATSVQMFIAGVVCLRNFKSFDEFEDYFDHSIGHFTSINYSKLEPLIEQESSYYKKGGKLTYLTSSDLAISVLTDTTERSPTFNLAPFETIDDNFESNCFLSIEGTDSSHQAWDKLLGRKPRELDWGLGFELLKREEIYKFDISVNSLSRRSNSQVFTIKSSDEYLIFTLGEYQADFNIKDLDRLQVHMVLKVLLNSLSTLIMGRIDRFESNIMTWVRPSNFKLIDRASRYIIQLLKLQGVEVEYETVLKFVYEWTNQKYISSDSVVLAGVEYFNLKQ